jgi:hypothetical protein
MSLLFRRWKVLRLLGLWLASVMLAFTLGRQLATPSAPSAADGAWWWTPKLRAGKGSAALERLLEHAAVNNEVLACVSNSNMVTEDGTGGMLADWVRWVRLSNVTNFVVFALDQETYNAMIRIDVHVHLVEPQKMALGGTFNHAASAQKFHVVKQVLDLGYSVLLSDTDVITLQNPFRFLVRDCDVEGMSDGYDAPTAQGRVDGDDDPAIGWGRYSQAWRIFTLNSGLFYLRASERTSALVQSVHAHLQLHKDWDQTVWSVTVMKPMTKETHIFNSKTKPVTLRVMDRYEFVNSKTLFGPVRSDEALRRRRPVMVHLNQHSDKQERLRAIDALYNNNDPTAFDALPYSS